MLSTMVFRSDSMGQRSGMNDSRELLSRTATPRGVIGYPIQEVPLRSYML